METVGGSLRKNALDDNARHEFRGSPREDDAQA